MFRYLLLIVLAFQLCLPVLSQPTTPLPGERTVFYSLRPTTTSPYGSFESDHVKQYISWADLAERSQRETNWISLSLTLDSAAHRADWPSLRQVRRVRSVQLTLPNPLRQSVADSLLNALAQWPALVDISFSVTRTKTGTKQNAIDGRGSRQLKALTSCTLSSEDEGLRGLLSLISQAPALARISIFNGSEGVHPLPIELGQLQALRRLFLGGAYRMEDLEAVLPRLVNLTSLRVQQTGTGRQLTRLLRQVPKLRHLDLGMHQATPDSPDGLRLSGLPYLDTLTIGGGFGRLVPLDSALADVRTLKRVSLNEAAFSSLDWLARNPALQSVALSACRFAPTGRSLAGLPYLTQVRIQRSDSLQQFPTSLTTLPNLQDLTINSTLISTLPPSIGALTSLTALNLQQNKLTSLPAELGKLTNLRLLSLDNNRLTALPAELGRLDQLVSLMLSKNRLTALPAEIGRLRKLRDLYMYQNQLTQLPAEIGQCRQLTGLTLDENPLTSLPESIGNLDSLRSLSLNKTRLTALPASVGNWKKLESLYIGGSRLTSLPTTIGNWQKLDRFTLTDSTLTQLPAAIGNWSKLSTLGLTLPQLQQLPAELTRLANLTDLHLTLPQLLSLPDELSPLRRLTSLSLTSQRIRGLPSSIGKLTALRTLRLDGGMDPTEIDKPAGQLLQLPDSVIRCLALTDITVQNQVAFDGNDALQKATRLPQLQSMTLNRVGMDRLADIDWKALPIRSLSLRQNSLRDVPGAILDAPKLESVDLSYNFPLPRPLTQSFWTKEGLRVAFTELTITNGSPATDKPNAAYMQAFQNSAMRHMQQRNWGEAFADLDKAIQVAPDTLKALPLSQRASFRFFQKEYAPAIADFEQALRYSRQLSGVFGGSMMASRLEARQMMVAQWWGQMGSARLALGQYERAIQHLDSALRTFPNVANLKTMQAHFHTEQGKAWANLSKPDSARRSLNEALTLYAGKLMSNPGEVLTEAELAILTNQPVKATEALSRFRRQYVREGRPAVRGGFVQLAEYLTACVAVLTDTQTPEQAQTALATYLKTNPDKIRGWSFDLFETTLPRLGFSAATVQALSTLTALTKEQLAKME